MTNFQMVGEFMKAFGQEVKVDARIPEENIQTLRYELIREELEELLEGQNKRNLIEIADALTDLLYVVYGAGHSYGIDLDACFKEVQRSNMSKLGSDGNPIYRQDGKVMKGPNFSEPNLGSILMYNKSKNF